jgi:spermidine/putrescine transport system substrate-binding protein
VPFTVYKTGIGWRTDKVDTMTGSWRDLWNPQAAKRIFTLDDQDEALAMGALLLGYDVNTTKSSQLEAIKKLLISQKKYLRAYSSDDVNDMSRGDAWIHHMWSGDFLYLRQGVVEHPGNFDFEAPEEGTPINSDTYAIPANAKHPGTAMVFIDYLLRPENVKKNMEYLYYPFPTQGGEAYFKQLAKDVPSCNVDVKALENPDVFRLLSPAEVQKRTAVWTEVKAS